MSCVFSSSYNDWRQDTEEAGEVSIIVMAVNIPGLVMMVVFYLLVLGIGIWASVKSKKKDTNTRGGLLEFSFLANRSVGLILGVFTVTGTTVGGGFILGIAECVYNPNMGLVWALLPLQRGISFVLCGLFFAKPMRENNYISMMDPFQRKYGKVVTAALSVMPIITAVFWTATLLTTLGSTMKVVLGLPYSVCVWISAGVAIIYTALGGLYSVASTDVIQISLAFVGLWLCIPFLLTSESYTDITETAFNHVYQAPWLGRIQVEDVGIWIDDFLLLTFGNVAIQDIHQRTLSASSSSTAKFICFAAAGCVIICGIPSILIGAVAASTDWNSTSYGSPSPHERGEMAMVLPIALDNLIPTYISAVGIAAIAAAVMSSADSVLLSGTTIFTTNIYQAIRSQASEKELRWVICLCIVVIGLVGTSITYMDGTTMVFWFLGSDPAYTTLLPQLICVLFVKVSNGYGAITGYLVSVLLRLLCGEPLVGLPVILQLPGCTLKEGIYVQRFPVKTLCMLSALASIPLVSYVASVLFDKEILPERLDVFKVKSQKKPRAAETDRDKCASQAMLETQVAQSEM